MARTVVALVKRFGRSVHTRHEGDSVRSNNILVISLFAPDESILEFPATADCLMKPRTA
jgi:hypothetical protein